MHTLINAIAPVQHPTRQQIREWMQQRQAERKPLPTQEEIKRQLGHYEFLNKQSAECAR